MFDIVSLYIVALVLLRVVVVTRDSVMVHVITCIDHVITRDSVMIHVITRRSMKMYGQCYQLTTSHCCH